MTTTANGNAKRIDDLEYLVATALKSLTQALRDGDEKHPPGSWAEESSGNQINHLLAHMRQIQAGEWTDERGHSHVAHVVCRAVMLAALRASAVDDAS